MDVPASILLLSLKGKVVELYVLPQFCKTRQDAESLSLFSLGYFPVLSKAVCLLPGQQSQPSSLHVLVHSLQKFSYVICGGTCRTPAVVVEGMCRALSVWSRTSWERSSQMICLLSVLDGPLGEVHKVVSRNCDPLLSSVPWLM